MQSTAEKDGTTYPSQFLWWVDKERPWWAKLRRAGEHIATLTGSLDDLKRSGAWLVDQEPGDEPDVVVYRLRVHQRPPSDVLTVVGDVIHNLSSALDAVAYRLGRAEPRNVGR